MTLSTTIQTTLSRHQTEIQSELQQVIRRASELTNPSEDNPLNGYYGQMQYHLGWVNAQLVATPNNPGKLLRPTLLLLAYEAAGAAGLANELEPDPDYLNRALPAAAAIEIIHNFTLVHDDIEDGDAERRHRPTLWNVWGIPQAINTGDGMFALGRMTLWRVLDAGVESSVAARLGAALDLACLVLSEGQYLDISFENQLEISTSMYVDMINRKTAALMACAAEMGARLGTEDAETIKRLRAFGEAMGIAFQVRDDLLGVWASTAELGKTPAGDVYRRKKSLPILHALEHANADDQTHLRSLYQQTSDVTPEQVKAVLAIFERTGTQEYCRRFLAQHCQLAHEALANVPATKNATASRAMNDLATMLAFVESAVRA